MRTRPDCVALLVLASLSCATPERDELNPERFRCPTQLTEVTALPAPLGESDWDTEDDDTYPDLRIHSVKGVRDYAQVDTDPEETFEVTYDAAHGAISWEKLPRAAGVAARPDEPAPAPLELAPPLLARVIPDLQTPVGAACLARPEVSEYLGVVRDRMQSRWTPPKLGLNDDRNVVLLFSLSASGEVTGACYRPAVSDAFGATAVRALRRSAPFDAMDRKKDATIDFDTECLAGHRLVGNFTAR